ncbi:MAG TPA: hypothetical protein VD886_13810 [Herpetosiphonaceae bacterium]|nr:hypothetical protein [Herpetosiphonaceae bacterium]
MFLTTPTQETLADFIAEALICQDCHAEMAVVGPLPASPACAACGSSDVVAVVGATTPLRHPQGSRRRAA